MALKIFIVAVAIVAAVAIIKLDTTGKSGSGLPDAYKYDIDKLAKIDPNLITYSESTAAFDTGLTASQAIATDSQGKIYVAGDKSIRIFGHAGDLVSELTLKGEPRSIAVDTDGKIYTAINDHIEVYDPTGKQLDAWESLGDKAILTSIAVAKDDVFVADAANRIVIRYDKQGKVIKRIGKKDPDRNIPGFVIPSPYFDLAIARDGLLRVVNSGMHRIEAYTFDGDFENSCSWGEFSSAIDGFVGCCNPVNFAILSDGNFITCEKGLVRVKVYNAEGKFTAVVAGPEQLIPGKTPLICNYPSQCQSGGFDIAVGTEDQVYVLDTVKNVIRTYSKAKNK
ncbi:MAG: NHL repeat-containing protein [Planctomycetota bacterium]